MRSLALAALLVLAASPLALGQAPAEAASFLVYHASGGRDPDPLASPLADPPEVDRLPATLFDRAERADNAPENAPESAPAHYRELERRLSSREAAAAPTMWLRGEVANGTLRMTVRANASIDARLVVFEHGPPIAGVPQPYVARFMTASNASPLPTPGSALTLEIGIDPAWDPSRLGVVAIAFDEGEVVQSVTWLAGEGEVSQSRKGVLIEHVTASWCDPCKPADEALSLLALQRGRAPALSAGELDYFRAPSWTFYAGIGLGGLAAITLLRRRAE